MRPTAYALWVIALMGCSEPVTPAPVASQAEPPAPPAVSEAALQETSTAAAAPSTASGDPSPPAAPNVKQPTQTQPGGKPMSDKVVKTEEEWKQILTPMEYYVLREKGTERPFVNKYDHHFEPGSYVCAACGQELFTSDAKFNSGCGWPAFYAAKAGDKVKLTPDFSHNMVRTEVTCARCDSHLGHIFDDAPQTPTGQRYCINSVSIRFVPAAKPGEATKPADGSKPASDDKPAAPKPE